MIMLSVSCRCEIHVCVCVKDCVNRVSRHHREPDALSRSVCFLIPPKKCVFTQKYVMFVVFFWKNRLTSDWLLKCFFFFFTNEQMKGCNSIYLLCCSDAALFKADVQTPDWATGPGSRTVCAVLVGRLGMGFCHSALSVRELACGRGRKSLPSEMPYSAAVWRRVFGWYSEGTPISFHTPSWWMLCDGENWLLSGNQDRAAGDFTSNRELHLESEKGKKRNGSRCITGTHLI